MKGKSLALKVTLCVLVAAMCIGVTTYAQKQQVKYFVHDPNRPRPPVMTPPAQFGQPPADAIILFDGKDLSQWEKEGGSEAKWKIEKDYMEAVAKAGSIRTKKPFGNCQLHIEWQSPEKVTGSSQGRGNSGIFLMSRYELQVLDSYENETYADGQAASIYGQYPPLVNVCRKPGEWQSYDVSFLRPIFDESGKCIRPARITMLHNGVVVQNNIEIQGATAHKQKAAYSRHEDKLPISIQDHGNPVRFRNIWIRELPEQPYLITE
jgi:hypothetical protein